MKLNNMLKLIACAYVCNATLVGNIHKNDLEINPPKINQKIINQENTPLLSSLIEKRKRDYKTGLIKTNPSDFIEVFNENSIEIADLINNGQANSPKIIDKLQALLKASVLLLAFIQKTAPLEDAIEIEQMIMELKNTLRNNGVPQSTIDTVDDIALQSLNKIEI